MDVFLKGYSVLFDIKNSKIFKILEIAKMNKKVNKLLCKIKKHLNKFCLPLKKIVNFFSWGFELIILLLYLIKLMIIYIRILYKRIYK